jgi:hypothetical protein
MKKTLASITIGFSLAAGGPAWANLVGDKDCFGLGGVCADGALYQSGLGGSFFTDYRSAADVANAPFTDIWGSDAGISYTHSGTAGQAAMLTLRIAGVADNRGPWDVFGDGVLLGQILTNTSANAFEEVLTYNFNVGAGLMADGLVSVLLNINVPGVTDGYSIDYSELTSASRTVPEPVSGALVALGLAGLALGRRRQA